MENTNLTQDFNGKVNEIAEKLAKLMNEAEIDKKQYNSLYNELIPLIMATVEKRATNYTIVNGTKNMLNIDKDRYISTILYEAVNGALKGYDSTQSNFLTRLYSYSTFWLNNVYRTDNSTKGRTHNQANSYDVMVETGGFDGGCKDSEHETDRAVDLENLIAEFTRTHKKEGEIIQIFSNIYEQKARTAALLKLWGQEDRPKLTDAEYKKVERAKNKLAEYLSANGIVYERKKRNNGRGKKN